MTVNDATPKACGHIEHALQLASPSWHGDYVGAVPFGALKCIFPGSYERSIFFSGCFYVGVTPYAFSFPNINTELCSLLFWALPTFSLFQIVILMLGKGLPNAVLTFKMCLIFTGYKGGFQTISPPSKWIESLNNASLICSCLVTAVSPAGSFSPYKHCYYESFSQEGLIP